jgi:hypothetical protein
VIQALVAIGLIAGASCGLELLMDRYAKSEARGQLRGGQQQVEAGPKVRSDGNDPDRQGARRLAGPSSHWRKAMNEDDEDVPEWLVPVMIVACLALLAAVIVFSNV